MMFISKITEATQAPSFGPFLKILSNTFQRHNISIYNDALRLLAAFFVVNDGFTDFERKYKIDIQSDVSGNKFMTNDIAVLAFNSYTYWVDYEGLDGTNVDNLERFIIKYQNHPKGSIKRCPCCDKLFIQTQGFQKFCKRTDGENRTCTVETAQFLEPYYKKADDLEHAYVLARQTLKRRVNEHRLSKKDYDEWRQECVAAFKEYRTGDIDRFKMYRIIRSLQWKVPY